MKCLPGVSYLDMRMAMAQAILAAGDLGVEDLEGLGVADFALLSPCCCNVVGGPAAPRAGLGRELMAARLVLVAAVILCPIPNFFCTQLMMGSTGGIAALRP